MTLEHAEEILKAVIRRAGGRVEIDHGDLVAVERFKLAASGGDPLVLTLEDTRPSPPPSNKSKAEAVTPARKEGRR